MRRSAFCFALIFLMGALAFGGDKSSPVVCVSAIADDSGKTIGPLGNLNDELAADITKHRKPLKGSGLPQGPAGTKVSVGSECDYLLEITLHVGASTSVAANPPAPNPMDPANDPQRIHAKWMVRANFRVSPASEVVKPVTFDDSVSEVFEPNVMGYRKDLPSVARDTAHVAANNASSKLKKKLKL